MDIRWLQDFLALAELRNFTRAAEVRHLSQAAFSRRIQSLERWVGAELVRKGVQPVQLTVAGVQFLDQARSTVERLYQARAMARVNLVETQVQICLAMPSVLARSGFGQMLKGLSSSSVSFAVTVGTTAEVIARYIAGDADLLIAYDCPALPCIDGLAQEERVVLQCERFRLYAAAGRGDFGFPGSVKEPFPLIGYTTRAYFNTLQEELLSRAGNGASYRLVMQCEMSDVLHEVIHAGYGLGWLPESAVKTAPSAPLVAVGGPEWELPMEICAFRPRRRTSNKLNSIWNDLAATFT